MTSVTDSAPKGRWRRFVLYSLIPLALSAVLVAAFLGYQRGPSAQAVRVASYALSQTDPPIPPQSEIRALNLSRRGTLLAVGLSNDTTLVWRVTGDNPQTIGSLKMGLKPRDRIGMNVAIAEDAPLVAIGVKASDLDDPKRAATGRIRVWNFETQKSQDVWESKDGFGALAISPKGERVAVWDVPHRPLQVIDCTTQKIRWNDPKVDYRFGPLAFSPDGRYLAAGVDREIRVYESDTGKLVRRCTGEMGSTTSIAFSSDGSRIVTGGAYPAIRVWGVHDAKDDVEIPLNFPARRNASIEAVAFTPDSQAVLAFIPKFEKATWWDRLWRASSVDSFDHVGAMILRHSLSEKVTTSLLDTDVLYTNGCFCPDAGQIAMWSDLETNGRTLDIFRY
jgi:WD40 repeat protein